MTREQVQRALDGARAAGELARIGMLKNAWVTDGSAAAAEAARAQLRERGREYGGAWWKLKGVSGFAVPDRLDAQMARNADTAAVGPPEAIAAELRDLAELGVDLVVLHVHGEETRPAHREAMARIANDVVPALA
jgi:hypothetical protein